MLFVSKTDFLLIARPFFWLFLWNKQTVTRENLTLSALSLSPLTKQHFEPFKIDFYNISNLYKDA